MDQAYAALAQLGGVGALALALLFLHREAIRAFKEEMAAEREIFREALAKFDGYAEAVAVTATAQAGKLELILDHVRRCGDAQAAALKAPPRP